MPRRVQRTHGQPTGLHRVAVDDADVGKRHVVVGRQRVGGAGCAGELQPAGDVVVVHVRLEHVGDLDARASGQVEDTVDVALRVHDHGDLAVVHQVAAVPQARRFDRQDSDTHRIGLLTSSLCPPANQYTPWGILVTREGSAGEAPLAIFMVSSQRRSGCPHIRPRRLSCPGRRGPGEPRRTP